MQCCTCSNWVHLNCSFLTALTPGAALPAAFMLFWRFHIYQHCGFLLGLPQLVYLHCLIRPIRPPFANAALAPNPRLQTSYPFSTHFVSSPSAPSPSPHAPGCFSLPPASSSLPNSFRVLQWNAGGFRARSIELVHFLLSHPVDLICIQVSNLNLSSSFLIPGFSALRSDGTHSRSGIFSTDDTDASGGVIIFIRQGLSFSELSTSSLSSLDPYSDYVEVNIFLNNYSSLSFLNVYAPPIRSSPNDSRTNFFSPSILPFHVEAEAVEFLRFRFHIPGYSYFCS